MSKNFCILCIDKNYIMYIIAIKRENCVFFLLAVSKSVDECLN